MKPWLCIAVLWLAPLGARAEVMAPARAAEFAGQVATVEGRVAEVKFTRQRAVFLNFEKKYPGNVFAVVHQFKGPLVSLDEAAAWRALQGQRVRVAGRVSMTGGRALIHVAARAALQPVPAK